MDGNSEVIALLLGEPLEGSLRPLIAGAQTLVRGADGRVRLQAIESAEEFDELSRTTGCFRRGKPIRDPGTREVIGYEMEEITPGPLACAG